jgi:hypothetical protein
MGEPTGSTPIAERALRLMQELHDEGWSTNDATDICASAISGITELRRLDKEGGKG